MLWLKITFNNLKKYVLTETKPLLANQLKLVNDLDLVKWNSNSSKQTFDRDKTVKLSYSVYENKPRKDTDVPLIILHGLLGSKKNWVSIANKMLLRLNNSVIYTVDLRNHGDSPHTDEFSYELMVGDMLAFLHDNAIEKPFLIGHSMGGRVGMLLALKYPQLVQRLVVVDIAPHKNSPDLMALPMLFEVVESTVLSPHESLSDARKQAFQQLRWMNVDSAVANFLLTSLVKDQQKAIVRWQFNIKSISNNFKSGIVRFPMLESQYKGPTLFLSGEASNYVKPKDEPEIKHYFPSAQFVYIKDASHWLHAEKPDEFLDHVSTFLLEN